MIRRFGWILGMAISLGWILLLNDSLYYYSTLLQ
jgi:hypothetical protein